MSFLKKLQSQPRSVRVAITWGMSILIVALVAPLWLSSIQSNIDPINDDANLARREKDEGAIGLFFGSAFKGVGNQFGDIGDALGGLLGSIKDATEEFSDIGEEGVEMGNQEKSSIVLPLDEINEPYINMDMPEDPIIEGNASEEGEEMIYRLPSR